jgi:hypothetical protein
MHGREKRSSEIQTQNAPERISPERSNNKIPELAVPLYPFGLSGITIVPKWMRCDHAS